mgnify:CR=1 FL=1
MGQCERNYLVSQKEWMVRRVDIGKKKNRQLIHRREAGDGVNVYETYLSFVLVPCVELTWR